LIRYLQENKNLQTIYKTQKQSIGTERTDNKNAYGFTF